MNGVDGIDDLTQLEYRLFESLRENAPDIHTRPELFESVWGCQFEPGTNRIDVLVYRLRKKLKNTPYQVRSKEAIGYYITTREIEEK